MRLQTWFPFTVQIVINGREWLGRQLCRRGIAHERRDNCFVDVADLALALGRRPEGVRVKHAIDRNSIKIYDKQTSVLRIETTINNTRQMKVYRTCETNPDGPKSYQRLRKGVADLNRRADISQKCNERYLEGLAAVDAPQTLAEAAQHVCQRTVWHNRSARALNPLASDDARLLEAVSRGEFNVLGFRNRDLCALLFADEASLTDRQKMAKVTRLIRLLRAHGLVQKVPRTHRYTLTKRASRQLILIAGPSRDSAVQVADLRPVSAAWSSRESP